MPDSVRAVSPDGLRAGAATPGVIRELALETQVATVMRARAEAHACSGWHHHGGRDVLGYVVVGRALFEFGSGGAESVDVETVASSTCPRASCIETSTHSTDLRRSS
jgi:quercetin dioxygenase-like cupin family protein